MFQRWNAKSEKGSEAATTGRSALDLRCFSLVAEDRTLDLVAADRETAELWIEALSYLWLFAHTLRERATRTGRWQSWQPPRYSSAPPSRALGESPGQELGWAARTMGLRVQPPSVRRPRHRALA